MSHTIFIEVSQMGPELKEIVDIDRQNALQIYSLLGAFAKLRKTTIGFVMSVCLSARPSVYMEQFGFYWTDFHEILYLNSFRKSVEKIQLLFKWDKK